MYASRRDVGQGILTKLSIESQSAPKLHAKKQFYDKFWNFEIQVEP